MKFRAMKFIILSFRWRGNKMKDTCHLRTIIIHYDHIAFIYYKKSVKSYVEAWEPIILVIQSHQNLVWTGNIKYNKTPKVNVYLANRFHSSWILLRILTLWIMSCNKINNFFWKRYSTSFIQCISCDSIRKKTCFALKHKIVCQGVF